MNHYAGVLLVTNTNTVLLQQRDDKPGIVNPGLVTTFGGIVKSSEAPLQGAIREITEETNLKPREDELLFFKNFSKVEGDGTETKLHIFILKNVIKDTLEVYEGKDYFEIKKEDNLSKIKLSPTAEKIIKEYFKRY